jgi:hypothetical protein
LPRLAFKLPNVVEALQQDVSEFPPCNPNWSIDDHDQLLSKAFRAAWARHALRQAFPKSDVITQPIWDYLRLHAEARKYGSRIKTSYNKAFAKAVLAFLAWCRGSNGII